jgi:hypothetical protein
MLRLLGHINVDPGALIGGLLYPILVAKLLKLTDSVFVTVKAILVVVGKEQVQSTFSSLNHLVTSGMYYHSLLYHSVAGGGKLFHSLDLYHAQTAGADVVDPLQITQGRNLNAQGFCCMEQGGTFLDCQFFSVNNQIYHQSLPPFNTPQP